MDKTLRVGIAGLGNEGHQILPYTQETPDVELTAAADLRPEAVQAVVAESPSVRGFDSVEAMCASGAVDAIWIATPNAWHAEHTIVAAQYGVHVILEKPMCVTLDEGHRMVEAVERAGTKLLMHSHASDAPVVKMREIVASGKLGRLIGIHAMSYKSWLKSPRLAAELDTEQGGGVVYRQGPHQIEIVRRLGGGLVKQVRAYTGRWHPKFNTEGDYTALLEFADGTPATLVFFGYGYFNVMDLTWGVGESGRVSAGGYRKEPRREAPVEPAAYYAGPRRLHSTSGPAPKQPIYGLAIVSCEGGDLRQSPDGVYVYTDDGCEEIICPPYQDRTGDLLEMRDAILENRPVFPEGRWGRATLEVIQAILESSKEHRDVTLRWQVPTPI